ncbi:MAG: SpoIIE family protein phosphatase [Solirubrobacterales bacterium]
MADGGAAGSRPTRALVVDDERMNREVVVANLRAAGYETITAEDGVQAWGILDRLPHDFDVVLLDRRMPRMDGMELLGKIKADDRLRGIPVIMQTAYASSEDVVEGIKAGVYYYLGKPLDRRLLLSVVASAVEEHQRYRRLTEDLERRTTALSLMEGGTFRFRTLEEANTLAVALARTCPRSQYLVVGLSEIFTNAIEHGNLGIDFAEKARLIGDKTWAREIEARMDAPPYRDRWVTVQFERRPGEARITVRDEGQGFDWRTYMELDAARAFAAHGRGIAMARQLSFDSLEYRDPGNEVVCIVRCLDAESPAEASVTPAKAAAPAPAAPRSERDDDLKIACSMQTELLPPARQLEAATSRYGVRVSGFFEPSCELGGDIWGLDLLDESRFALWLADFSGHGVTAALNTFRLHALLQHIGERHRPGTFLEEVNRRLAGQLPVGQYCSMLYGVVDVAADSFTYAAAASPPPIAVAWADRLTQVGDGAGLPLGISKTASYAERRLAFRPGEALFMASDAFAESPAVDGGKLGHAGVCGLVGDGLGRLGERADVHAVLAPFLATVTRPLKDDLTAVCCVRP